MAVIAGIGGMNMDVHAKSGGPMVLGDSNPGRLVMSPGGVCRNVCENLSRLGHTVRLVSAVGNDYNGRALLEECEKAGIDVRAVRLIEGETTSSYVSVLEETGELFVAVSDMRILKRLDERLVDASAAALLSAERVVCDGNLSGKTVRRLIAIGAGPLYLDPVSTAWAREMRPYVGAFHTVKPNRMELAALTGRPCGTEEELIFACDALRGAGVRRVFVSLGAEGMLYRGPEGTIRGRSRPLPGVKNATGAGDAALAGIVHADCLGLSAKEALEFGMAAGMIATQSPDTISREMSPGKIKEMTEAYIL